MAAKGLHATKPRPWVVVQNDAYAGTDSIILCPLTHVLVEEASLLRVDVQPTPENGLRLVCQVQVEKIVTVRRGDVDRVIGRLEDTTMRDLAAALRRIIGP